MTDETAASVPAPVAPSTSLSTEAVAEKAQLETWMADPRSPYWRGDEQGSAAMRQERYRALTRGEAAGTKDGIGPAHAPDIDLPLDIGRYDIAGAPGMTTGEDRDIYDLFAPVALEAGIGQRKMRMALQWASDPTLTPASFRQLARGAGWSDRQIEACVKWHETESARRAGRT